MTVSKTKQDKPVEAVETALEPIKRPMGRPTKYQPEYCEEIIKLGKLGKSIAQMASHFDVDKASIYDWAEKHKDFSTALARARAHSQTWWENEAQKHLKTRDFNAQLWLKSVASRFRDDYTDRQQTEITGANGGAIKTESVVALDTSALDPEQREAIKIALQAAVEGGSK